MRTYRCEDVTLSERGIDSKGWLCNPQEKGKKPAILVLGPKDASNNTVLLQYATRLANYGFVVLGMEETQDVKAAIDYLSLKDEVDPNKMYAMGICNGTNEVLASTEAEKRLKAGGGMLQTQGGIAGKSSNHRYSRGEKRKGVSIRPTRVRHDLCRGKISDMGRFCDSCTIFRRSSCFG